MRTEANLPATEVLGGNGLRQHTENGTRIISGTRGSPGVAEARVAPETVPMPTRGDDELGSRLVRQNRGYESPPVYGTDRQARALFAAFAAGCFFTLLLCILMLVLVRR